MNYLCSGKYKIFKIGKLNFRSSLAQFRTKEGTKYMFAYISES